MNWKNVLKSGYFWLLAFLIFIIFFIGDVWDSIDLSKPGKVNLPKLNISGGRIGGISIDQISTEQWIMLAVALTAGILLLFFIRKVWKGLLVIAIMSLLFSGPRDWLMDIVKRPEISKAITGTETTKSVQVASLEPFKVCELEANTSYTFVKVTTSEKDTYRTLYPPDGSTEIHPITGGFYSTPEELPYRDANYAGGILINGLPPGRIITADKDGCTLGSFNRKSGSIRTLVNSLWIGIVFRK